MKRWFSVIVAVQLLFLVAEVAVNTTGLKLGQTIILKTVPVDPRSLTMGNYIQLRYEAQSIDLKHVVSFGTPLEEGEIFVGFAKGKPYSRAVSVSTTSPDFEKDLVWLRGSVTHRRGSVIEVEYGLDRYYIPENKSDEANRLAWSGGVISVEVSVDNAGVGRIKRVLRNGKDIGF